MIELYKWYKGTELPDRECDCIVIWSENWPYDHRDHWIKMQALGLVQKMVNTSGGNEAFEFVELPRKDSISQEDIIAWMPIEYPKDTSDD